eukprot:1229695-Amphidinium_carterae.1
MFTTLNNQAPLNEDIINNVQLLHQATRELQDHYNAMRETEQATHDDYMITPQHTDNSESPPPTQEYEQEEPLRPASFISSPIEAALAAFRRHPINRTRESTKPPMSTPPAKHTSSVNVDHPHKQSTQKNPAAIESQRQATKKASLSSTGRLAPGGPHRARTSSPSS